MNDVLGKFGVILSELSQKTKNFVVLNSGMRIDLNLEEFARLCEGRYFDFGHGISNMISSAQGFSVCGKTPILVGPAMYLAGRGWEQIRNNICVPNLNVKIIGVHSGFEFGNYGAGLQMHEDIALMRVLPNMKIFTACGMLDFERIMGNLLADFGPTYLRLEQTFGEENVYEDFKLVHGGKMDLAIFTCGRMVDICLRVAKELDASLFYVSKIKPLDEKRAIECSKKINVCVEEHSVIGGLGDALCAAIKVHKIGLADRFSESGSVQALFRKYGLDEEGIIAKVRKFAEGA